MVRSAIADDDFLIYLKSFSKLDYPTIGLVLGQTTAVKDYIIHLARTPPYNGDGQINCEKKFFDLSEIWIADHARHATRMLPGGMHVLGIFVVSSEDVLISYSSKLKAIIAHINKKLENNEFLHGNPLKNTDKLIIYYSSCNKSYICKNYNAETGVMSVADIKFEKNLSIKWLQLECRYELDQIFPIVLNKSNWSLKKHMKEILKHINDTLMCGAFFFDGEIKDVDDSLESIGKKRKVPRGKMGNLDDTKLLQVTIVLSVGTTSFESNIHILDCEGHIRLAGHVATKLWLHPKATVKEASIAIIQDIERSLASRLEMHWDSLIEEEQDSTEDLNSIHETPRRVLVNLPSSKINLSDYLFPGEGPQEAQISLKELLDIDISEVNSICDIEGQPDLPDVYHENMEVDSEDVLHKLPKTTNRYIYFGGLGIAFLVLLVSLLIHFIQQ